MTKVQEPFTIPFSIRAGTGIVEDAAGLKLGDYGNAKTAQWLCDRLNAPAPASHGEREAFEAWWRGYYHRADISIQMKPFAWAVWQAALHPRATLPGTQDARSAAEAVADWIYNPGREFSVQERPQFEDKLFDLIKHHTPSGPAALTASAEDAAAVCEEQAVLRAQMVDLLREGEAKDRCNAVIQGYRECVELIRRLTPEGSAAKEKTE